MKDLNKIGIYNEYLPVDLFNALREHIKISKNDKSPKQDKLAGNIREEYDLTKAIPIMNNYILGLINKNPLHVEQLKFERRKFANDSVKPSMRLVDLWANFQKKYEFNPLHDHSGLFSFIVFIQIPYDIQKELKEGPGNMSNSNFSSCLQFLTVNPLGKYHHEIVYVDKSYEGGIYIFNAEMLHCVYPFFTSDEYRITVSGNIGWAY